MLGSSMDHTNQALVDGMCDMSGGLPAAWVIFHTGLGLVGLAQLITFILAVASVAATELACQLFPTAGLVDAVQALQTRNRLLQGDLDTLKAKYAGRLWP